MVGTLVGNFSIPSDSPFSIQALLAWLFNVADICITDIFSTMFMFDAAGVCVIDFVPIVFFQVLLRGFGLLACSQRGFSVCGIGCSISSWASRLDSFRMGSLAMMTW